MGVEEEENRKKVEKICLSRFVEEYPSDQQLDMICLDNPSRLIFFSKTTTSSSCSSSGSSPFSVDETADPRTRMRLRIHDKIKLAFSKVYAPFLNGLIQFWAPVSEATTPAPAPTMLSTSHQPFVLVCPNLPWPTKYRLFSINSPLLYDDVGPHAHAYRTRFPDVVLPLKDRKGQSPLVDKALESHLTCLILLPVFFRTPRRRRRSFSPCVGVVECCVNTRYLPKLFLDLIGALNCWGFTTYHVQQHLPNLPTHGLNRAKDEIEDRLKFVCESLDLNLAQVWIVDDIVHHALSSPFEDEGAGSHHQTNQPGMFVVKLCGYQTDNLKLCSDYYKVCDVLPLKFGDGLAGKALQTHEPCFCNDLSKFQDYTGFSGLLFRKTQSSGFAICLRSSHTGKSVDYAFEFLWSESREPTIVLEFLFLILKLCLPSFTHVSGAPLGEELCVTVVSDPMGFKTPSFKILQGNKFSPPKGQREKVYKRKLRPFFKGNGQTDSDSDSGFDSDDHVYFWYLSADYRGEVRAFVVYKDTKLARIKVDIEKAFSLDPGTCTLEYQHEGEKVVINTDEDMAHCVRHWRASMKRTLNELQFRLFVLPSAPLPSSCEKSQESLATLG